MAIGDRLWRSEAIGSIPCAFLGGMTSIPTQIYKPIVGVVLLYASVKLGFSSVKSEPPETRSPSTWLPIVLGMAIGLLSGLTGVGGGIFLSPLLLLMGWATVRETAGVSAAFILVNSTATSTIVRHNSWRVTGQLLLFSSFKHLHIDTPFIRLE